MSSIHRPGGDGTPPTVVFIDKTSPPFRVNIAQIIDALHHQLTSDFVPVWGYPATLREDNFAKPGEWKVVFLDDADQANSLGYHDISVDGVPVSKVFVKSTLAAGQKISVTASHELLEMLIDPCAQLWAQNDDGLLYAYEACDAVEEIEYLVGDVAVSNFVFPSFFESWRKPNSAKFDFKEKVTRPFETLENGYQVVSSGGAIAERFGSEAKAFHFKTVENRTYHRSEYRIRRAQIGVRRALTGPAHPASVAATLSRAGRYLQALSGAIDPFPDGFDLARTMPVAGNGATWSRRRTGPIDPTQGGGNGPFDI